MPVLIVYTTTMIQDSNRSMRNICITIGCTCFSGIAKWWCCTEFTIQLNMIFNDFKGSAIVLWLVSIAYIISNIYHVKIIYVYVYIYVCIMYMCVCMCIYMYMYIYICICVYVYVYIYMYMSRCYRYMDQLYVMRKTVYEHKLNM